MDVKPVVCLITGPAGAGKSAVSKSLAERYEKSVFINVDNLRDMVIGSHVQPWPWSEEVKIQTSLGAKNACDIATNFLDNNFNVFIDDVVGEKLFNQYKSYFSDRSLHSFLLLPSLDELLIRFDNRRKDDELRERTQDLHAKFSVLKEKLDWHVIDSGKKTIRETTDEIFSIIQKFQK